MKKFFGAFIALLLTVTVMCSASACGCTLSKTQQNETLYEDVINSLKSGQAYAFASIAGDEYDALIVADEVYDNGDGTRIATSATLYGVDADGNLMQYGKVFSEGPTYPLSVYEDTYLLSGSKERVSKVFIDIQNGAMCTKEDASAHIGDDGKVHYFYFSLDEEFEGEVQDDSHLVQLFKEYGTATPINFTVIR